MELRQRTVAGESTKTNAWLCLLPPARLPILTLLVAIIVAGSVGQRQRSTTSPAVTERPTVPQPLRRLKQAFDNLGRPPDNVLREVRRFVRSDKPLCDFQWNNGQPIPLNQNQVGTGLSDAAFTRCAAVVEALPTGRMRLLFRIKDESGSWTINPRWPNAIGKVIDHKLSMARPGVTTR